MSLSEMAERMNELLHGETVKQVWIHRDTELVIEFQSGARLFVDSRSTLEFSVT